MPRTAISQSSALTLVQERFGAIENFSALSHGEDSAAFGFAHAGEDYVARFNTTMLGFEKDALAGRSFASPALPIPEVICSAWLDMDLAWCVTRRAPGSTLQALAPHALPPVLAPVARTMAAIAASDISGTRGFGRFDGAGNGSDRSWHDFLTVIVDAGRYDWSAAARHIGPDRIRRVVDRVCALAGHCPEARHLVHGDFGSNNVLVAHGRVTGVIDWSEALFGDPLYDHANILFWRPWLDCMEALAGWLERHRPDEANALQRLVCYHLRIGLEQVFQYAGEGNGAMVAWAMDRCEQIVAAQGPGSRPSGPMGE